MLCAVRWIHVYGTCTYVVWLCDRLFTLVQSSPRCNRLYCHVSLVSGRGVDSSHLLVAITTRDSLGRAVNWLSCNVNLISATQSMSVCCWIHDVRALIYPVYQFFIVLYARQLQHFRFLLTHPANYNDNACWWKCLIVRLVNSCGHCTVVCSRRSLSLPSGSVP